MPRTNPDSRLHYWLIVVLVTVLAYHLASALTSDVGQPGKASANTQSSLGDVPKLEAGKPIEREMKGGESHNYEILLEAGQYLNVTVDQRGIDVVVKLIAPNGKQLTEVESPNGTQGPKQLEYICGVSGSYHLRVASLEKDAPVGRYLVKIVEVRAATENDRAVQEATQLNQEVEHLFGEGKYSAAIPLAERALVIRQNSLASDNPSVAESLSNLALLYKTVGEYAKAEPLYERALSIYEKALGPTNPSVAYVLANLSALYNATGDYAKAEPLIRRSLSNFEKTLGPYHAEVGTALSHLGALYENSGDYAKAEPIFQRSLSIFEKSVGSDHPLVAGAVNNLAHLYEKMGNYSRAEPLYQRSLSIREKAFGPNHPEVAGALNNLAALYDSKNEYGKAEPLYQRSLSIKEKAFGPDSPDVALALNNLAGLYVNQGDYARVEPLIQRSFAIFEKTLGPNHPDMATALNNLAYVYYTRGDYAKAELLFQRSLLIREIALGSDHPDLATTLSNLAALYGAKGETQRAIGYQVRCNDSADRSFTRNLSTGSESQRVFYIKQTAKYTDTTLSLHAQQAPDDLAARRMAMKVILQRKGRALDATADAVAALRRRASPEDQKIIDRLADARAHLSRATLGGPGRESIEKHKSDLKALDEVVEKLEAELSDRSVEFRVQATPVTIELVQKSLPARTALIEYAAYRTFDPKTKRDEAFGTTHYSAYVLQDKGEVLWVELGEAKPIDDAINSLRDALRKDEDKPLSNIDRDVKPLARKVDELMMRPVRRLLGTTNDVFLSPDGAINLLPFAALVDEKGEYLIKRYHFTYLTSGRDLFRLQERLPSKTAMTIVANPDYGPMSSDATGRGLKTSKPHLAVVGKVKPANAINPEATPLKAIDFSQVEFPPLAGTEQEARALKALMPEAMTLLHEQATKAAVERVNAPSILHVATHGFFLEDLVVGTATDDGGVAVGRSPGMSPAMRVENPLLRSGLALAGANLHKSGHDNGILTAFEVSGLNLWGTKLVVLSACETGVGEVKNGDGVYGLRRALVLAGSESQLLSLWKVDDEGTRNLMIDYYRRLKSGQGRSEALRQTQLKMLSSKDRQHPYFWASFIESGEWANLDGKR
jgi:CHAT domain-containing protein/Tfp pilus assembly protein PilF